MENQTERVNKMKIISILTHHHVVPNPYAVIFQ